MSVDLMHKLMACGAIAAPELQGLLNLSQSSVYRYAESTELKYGQVKAMLRYAEDDRVRKMIAEDLFAFSGAVVSFIAEDLDANGDGDIDTDDALGSCADAIDQASVAIKVLLHRKEGATQYIDARRALSDAAERCLAATAIIDWLERQASKRKPARRGAVRHG